MQIGVFVVNRLVAVIVFQTIVGIFSHIVEVSHTLRRFRQFWLSLIERKDVHYVSGVIVAQTLVVDSVVGLQKLHRCGERLQWWEKEIIVGGAVIQSRQRHFLDLRSLQHQQDDVLHLGVTQHKGKLSSLQCPFQLGHQLELDVVKQRVLVRHVIANRI